MSKACGLASGGFPIPVSDIFQVTRHDVQPSLHPWFHSVMYLHIEVNLQARLVESEQLKHLVLRTYSLTYLLS